jgi:hypothetical protein
MRDQLKELNASHPQHHDAVVDLMQAKHEWVNVPGQKIVDLWTREDVAWALALIDAVDPKADYKLIKSLAYDDKLSLEKNLARLQPVAVAS